MDLKIKIYAILIGILFLAMLLMNMVTLHITQLFLFLAETHKGEMLAGIIDRTLQYKNDRTGIQISEEDTDSFQQALENENCGGAFIIDHHKRRVYRFGDDAALNRRLAAGATQVLRENTPVSQFYGTSWGVFWKQPQIAIICQAIVRNGNTIGAVALAMPLFPALENKRKIQQIAFLYVIINAILFSGIGFISISRLTIKPIRRLTKRAAEYRYGDGPLLPYESGGGQWDVLSKAVNRIVDLNMEDNLKLKGTVQSLKSAMEELKKAQLEVIRAEKLATVGRLSSGIAHEIGNPIGIILGYLELLKQHALSDNEKEDFIRRVEQEVRRIDKIIRQLLDFSRPNGATLSPVSIHEIISEFEEIIGMQPLLSDIQVEIDLSAENDRVMADPSQLHQAFMNLILNAADAIKSGDVDRQGKVFISTELLEDKEDGADTGKPFIKLAFEDNGQGIRKESLEQIFDPFFTTKSPGKGTGLGLWVSIMIIEGFGGKITAESDYGEGTTMTLYLPIVAENEIQGNTEEER